MPEITKFKTTIIDDDYWEIVEEYKYATSKGIIIVPAGFRTDYASVPRVFRNIINSYGKHGRAAVIHDWLYSIKCPLKITREEADQIFLEIMEECEVPKWKRVLMYRLVRLFGGFHYRKGA